MTLNDLSTGMWLVGTAVGATYRFDMDERQVALPEQSRFWDLDYLMSAVAVGQPLRWLDDQGLMHKDDEVVSVERV